MNNTLDWSSDQVGSHIGIYDDDDEEIYGLGLFL